MNYKFVLSPVLFIVLLVSCSSWEMDVIDFTPLPLDDWEISTPEAEGLGRGLLEELYFNAGKREKLYGLLIIKNDKLIAEQYFNGGSIDQEALIQSVSKSYISALVGIALDQGYLESLDQKMMDFFPEYEDEIRDPRKFDITLRHMLEMRAGYPREESDPTLWDAFMAGDHVPLIVHVPLINDPGTVYHYSTMTSDWLGIIVSRATGRDLREYAQEALLNPIESQTGEWTSMAYDPEYYYSGMFRFTARDKAKFGLLYLHDGMYQGHQVISKEFVNLSQVSYTSNPTVEMGFSSVGEFKNFGYGYQWWSADAGHHQVNMAWGHGGQLIVLIDDLSMVIVVTTDPFHRNHFGNSWKYEKATLKMVADFIAELPKE